MIVKYCFHWIDCNNLICHHQPETAYTSQWMSVPKNSYHLFHFQAQKVVIWGNLFSRPCRLLFHIMHLIILSFAFEHLISYLFPFSVSSFAIILYIIFFLLMELMKRLNGMFSFPSTFIFPEVRSLKNWYMAPVALLLSFPSSFDLEPPLIIVKNSANSIISEPSSSTSCTIDWTCWRLSTRPRAIRGSSSSSTPMLPDPSSSRLLK